MSSRVWMILGVVLAASLPAMAEKAAPLPLQTIEGVSGGAITPMAYLCNRGPEGTRVGMPSVSITGLSLGSKKLGAFAYTQTFFRRVEIGYAYNYLDLGSFPDDIRKAGLPTVRDDVQLHHFNLRGMLVEEDSFNLPLPALTIGAHFKYNEGIKDINEDLGGALRTAIDYERHYGMDFTLTASKTLPTLAFGRPIILTGGVRRSEASQLGLLGFGDDYETSFEWSIACLPMDKLLLAYEWRQKENPYGRISGLVSCENNWHAFSASWLVNNHLSVSAVYGLFGNIANSRADNTVGFQIKYEF